MIGTSSFRKKCNFYMDLNLGRLDPGAGSLSTELQALVFVDQLVPSFKSQNIKKKENYKHNPNKFPFDGTSLGLLIFIFINKKKIGFI